ncbi:MAG: protein kinase [Planctomycetota bacterium]
MSNEPPGRPEDSALSPAEDAYFEYLSRRERGEGLSFDAFCTEHPALGSQLREVHAAWQWLADMQKPGCSGAFLVSRVLEQAPGSGPPRSADHEHHVLTRLLASGASGRGYQLVREVARGGMGIVDAVWDPALRRTVARKTCALRLRSGSPPGLSASWWRALTRFLDEAQITGQLDHPGIVPVHELGVDDEGSAYFTMRLVEGRELGEIGRLARAGEEGWSLTRALGVLIRISETMAYAHEKGVVHRDLKPSNTWSVVSARPMSWTGDWPRSLSRRPHRSGYAPTISSRPPRAEILRR